MFVIDFSNHICTMQLQPTVNQYGFVLRKEVKVYMNDIVPNGISTIGDFYIINSQRRIYANVIS